MTTELEDKNHSKIMTSETKIKIHIIEIENKLLFKIYPNYTTGL